jgi:hypothetical protein
MSPSPKTGPCPGAPSVHALTRNTPREPMPCRQRVAPLPLGCRVPSWRRGPTCSARPEKAVQRAATPAHTATKLPYGTLTWLQKEEYAGPLEGLTAAAALTATSKQTQTRPQSTAGLARPAGQATPLLLARAHVAQAAASALHAAGGGGALVAALVVAVATAGCAGLLRRRPRNTALTKDVELSRPGVVRAAAATVLASPPPAQVPPVATGDKVVVQRVPYNEHLVVVEDSGSLTDEEVEALAKDLLTRNSTF